MRSLSSSRRCRCSACSEPGAAAACRATRGGRIAVIATESTVRGGAYQAAIARRNPNVTVVARACPIFVALAEEGWTDGPVVEAVIRRYLDDVFVAGALASHPDTLVLGCTHFPVLAPALSGVLGPHVAIVDSAATTADALADALAAQGLPPPSSVPEPCACWRPTEPERFARVGRRVSRPAARGGRRRDRGPAQRAVARSRDRGGESGTESGTKIARAAPSEGGSWIDTARPADENTRLSVRGGVPKRPTGADCKSAGLCLRRFESYPLHQ